MRGELLKVSLQVPFVLAYAQLQNPLSRLSPAFFLGTNTPAASGRSQSSSSFLSALYWLLSQSSQHQCAPTYTSSPYLQGWVRQNPEIPEISKGLQLSLWWHFTRWRNCLFLCLHPSLDFRFWKVWMASHSHPSCAVKHSSHYDLLYRLRTHWTAVSQSGGPFEYPTGWQRKTLMYGWEGIL